jgi:diguanylate cyclase
MESEKNTTNADALWKSKYSELLSESDRLGQEREVTEKLLCRTIIRLTLAANGLDEVLDPHLKKLRVLLKKGVKNERLREQLDAVSEALLRAEDEDKESVDNFDATALFGFLEYCAQNDIERAAIQKLTETHAEGQFSNLNALFLAASQLLADEVEIASKPGLLGRLFGRAKKSDKQDEEFSSTLKSKLLERLLDSLDVPVYLQHQLESLKQQAANEGGGAIFFKMLEDIISLLLQIKSKIQEEQEEIDEFLLSVTTRLEGLEHGTKGIKGFIRESSSASEKLNKNVAHNVSDLKSVSSAATTLDGLKDSVASKLDAMTAQLEEHFKSDKLRAEKADAQIEEMSSTIMEMEAESASLKDSIKLKHDMAFSDGLTGLPNRLAYDERATSEFARWGRFKESLALLVWDIDHFKEINDRFGHQAGDVALRAIAKVLASDLRETDFVARYGGEEFVMLMSGATKEEALAKANVLREKIKNCGFNSKGKPIKITASCGLTQFVDGDTIEKAFNRADKAMYQAKNGGRDQCVFG